MTSGILLLSTLFLLILVGVPVAYAFLGAGLIFVVVALDVPAAPLVAQATTGGADSIPLTAIPLFLLAGSLMNAGGITRRLVEFASVLFGRLPGGLGVVNVGTNVFFSGISGSAAADASAIGKAMIPGMAAQGYPRAFSAALTSTASIIGPIIPPSIPLIVYAIAANQKIKPLLVAGILPGLLLAAVLMVMVIVLALRRNYPRQGLVSARVAVLATRDSLAALLMPGIIIAGIVFGWFTATEAAAVAVLYALLLSTVFYRELDWRRLPAVFLDAARSSAVILFIIAAAAVLGQVFVRTGFPSALADTLGVLGPVLFLVVVNLILLVFGTFMEGNAAIIIFTPLLLPTAVALGIDPIHFGIIVVFNLMIGLVTPPVGMSLFISSNIARLPILTVARANIPFLAAALVTLVAITFWPQLSLALT
ncbi:TRAP transporter large permease [Pseudonocardia sp. MH-G8]|uniref:TRAP transporter large permease n=1 Tax=Pseudonocardia sp. MH-G8 TaxID=1854588 RepID=UPI000BA147D5|nr:TRAP transporter large permease [Pseudonocardia sp. MH-G8]OZM76897.1 C4-dicarboxylate ABC transporter permease [Pseudonocardia sp. MH-G8]